MSAALVLMECRERDARPGHRVFIINDHTVSVSPLGAAFPCPVGSISLKAVTDDDLEMANRNRKAPQPPVASRDDLRWVWLLNVIEEAS